MIDQRWQQVRRVLLIRLDNLGDVLVTTPAFHAVRRSLPNAELTLLASPVGAQVGRLDPDIDDVIVYQAPWMDPWSRLPHDPEREQRLISQLTARSFDGAIIFTSYHQSSLPAAYLCYLAGIPLRVAASIDGPGSLLTTRHKHPERMMHEVERGLDLVGILGITTVETDLVLAVPQYAQDEISDVLTLRGVNPQKPLVVIHPGCSMPARTYPWERYAEVADRLIEQLDVSVVLTGAEAERALVDCIQTRMRRRAVSVAGELSFPALCGLIETADLVITNNTGPMHIAAAVKTPVIALFALTNPPAQWGPWHVTHRQLYHDVPCRLCYRRICPYGHECLRLVTPSMVASAAIEMLAEACRAMIGSPDSIKLSEGCHERLA